MAIKTGSMFSGWRSAILVLLLMTVIVAPAIAGGLANSAWPNYQHDSKNTGQSGFVGPQTNNLLWTFPTGGSITGSPVIGEDGTVYIGSADKKVYALNIDGTEKWSYTTAAAITKSPTIGSDGTIYVGSGSVIYALNPDGNLKWSYTASTLSFSPTIGSDGTIYFTGGKRLYALTDKGTSADLKWFNESDSSSSNFGGVAVADDGKIYFENNMHIYAFASDGTFLWRYREPTCFVSLKYTPTVGNDGTVYFNYVDHMDAMTDSGSMKWQFYGESSPILPESFSLGSDGTVYFNQRMKVYALSDDGSGYTQKWSYTAGSYIRSPPAIGSDGSLYFGSDDFKVYSISPGGLLKWTYSTGNKVRSGMAIGSDGTLYAGSTDGKLYAFRDPVTPPVAGFSATPLTGPAPLAVQFTDASTSTEKLTYAWDFDNDGNVDSTEQSPLFTYSNPGTFDVSLTVTNSAGSDTMVKEAYIAAEKPIGAPEFPTMALPAVLIVGMFGTVLLIRRTKEN